MKLTRRAFLRESGRAGVGLALAFRLDGFAWPPSEAAADFAPNAYIRIGSDNIVRLWATRSEMGQGVRTLLPMVLADELGADWEKVVIEQAGPDPRFKGIRLRTSGSGSAAGTWGPLRKAAATAREMLITAASEQWQVGSETCRAEGGSVIHQPTGRKLSFGELAARAAKVPPPANPRLKDAKELRLVGKPIKRRDGQAIVRGAAVYGLDVKLPDMQYAVIARCPYLGGKLVSCDPAPAMKIAGVRQVVPVKTGFSGGVAVVAVNTWAALKGRTALHPVWDNGPNAAFDSALFTQEMEAGVKQPGYPSRRDGDAPAALARAQRTMEAVYEYPYQAHAPLETMNCTAHVHGSTCEIWVPTQAPEAAQQEAARLLGISPEAVQINVTMLGGGFGRRLQVDYVPEAVEISKAIGKPVQVMWTREDDMKHGFFHPPKIEYLRAAVDEQGFPTAWHHKSAGPSLSVLGLPSAEDKKNQNFYRDDGMPWGSFDNPYNFPDHWADFIPVESPVPTGPWRAVFYPATVFARESFLDEIAAGKMDPIEMRLRLLQPGNVLDLQAARIERARLIAVLRLVAEKSGWPTLPREEAGRRWGSGVACNVCAGDCYLAQVAEVTVSKDLSDIRVHRIISAVDCGLALNPLGLQGQVESAVAWGMTPVLGGQIHFKNSQAQEKSYSDFRVPHMDQAPRVETYFLQGSPMPGGFGETAVPTVAPAIANAIFAATGKRVRRLPITPEKLATS